MHLTLFWENIQDTLRFKNAYALVWFGTKMSFCRTLIHHAQGEILSYLTTKTESICVFMWTSIPQTHSNLKPPKHASTTVS